jgi:hypothetical protein
VNNCERKFLQLQITQIGYLIWYALTLKIFKARFLTSRSLTFYMMYTSYCHFEEDLWDFFRCNHKNFLQIYMYVICNSIVHLYYIVYCYIFYPYIYTAFSLNLTSKKNDSKRCTSSNCTEWFFRWCNFQFVSQLQITQN